jgi:hypothetical protein
MIKSVKEAKEIAKKYNNIKTDLERLTFLKVVLDNDCTMVTFDEIDKEIWKDISEIEFETFDDYHGWTNAVIELFEFAGITAEAC